MTEMDEKEVQEVEVEPRGKPKMVRHETLEFSGFDTAEQAKEFLNKAREELEETERRLDQVFRGTRTFFGGLDRLLGWWTQPEADREIEYHKEQIRRLEEQKKRALPES